MPTNTKADRCNPKVKGKKGKGSAAAKSTRPSFGKKLAKKSPD